jgi:hypothetical protein
VPGTDAVLEEQPIAGVLLAVVVAGVGYAAISLVWNGGVDPLETLIFAVVFTVVYVAFTQYFDV